MAPSESMTCVVYLTHPEKSRLLKYRIASSMGEYVDALWTVLSVSFVAAATWDLLEEQAQRAHAKTRAIEMRDLNMTDSDEKS